MKKIETREELQIKVNQLEAKLSELENTESKSSAWLENSPVCTKIVNLDFNLQYMSSAGVNALQIEDVSTYYGKPYPFSFFPIAYNKAMNANMLRAKETGETIVQEGAVRDIKGNSLWFEATITPVYNKQGEMDHLSIVSIDTWDKKQAKDKLQESEEQFRHMFNNHNAVMLLIEADNGQIIDANLSAQTFYGETDEALRRLTIQEINCLPEEDVLKLTKKADEEEQNYFIFPHRNAKGETRTVEVHSSPIIMKNKKVLFSIIHDVTERELAEEKLKESEEKFRALYNNAPLSYQSLNDDGNFRDVNPTWLSTLGYERVEVIGKSYKDFLHPNFQNDFEDSYLEFKESGFLKNSFYKIQHKAGHYLDIELEGRIGCNSDGSFRQTYCVFKDISEQKQAEEKVRLVEKNLQNTFDISPSIISKVNIETGYFVEANQAVSRILGYTVEEFISKPLIEIIHPEDRQRTIDERLEQQKGKKTTFFENRYLCKDGSYKWLAWHSTSVDDNGIVIAIGSDINEQKMIEQEMVKTKQFYENIIEGVQDGILVTDKNDVIYYANSAMGKISGVPREEIQELNILTGFAKETTDEFKAYYKQAKKEKKPLWYDIKLKTPSGKSSYQNGWLIPQYQNKTYLGVICTVRDVTKRSNAEGKVRKLSTAVEQSPSMTVITDTTGELEYVNPKFTEITGYNSTEAIGQKSNILKSGEQVASFYKTMWETINSGKVWRGQFHNKKKNGELFWEAASISAILNKKGEVVNYIKIGEDITEQKSIEEKLKTALEKALESDRLKSAFLSNMSHEIRTPMNGILGFINLLNRPNLSKAQIDRYSAIINKSGFRLLNTINDIIDISKIEAGEMLVSKSETSISNLMDEVYAFHSVEAKEKGLSLKLESSNTIKDLTVITDNHKLHGILTNLIKNAIKYTEKGSITFGYVLKNNCIDFYVEDTGIGISKGRLHAIFNRFEQADIEDRKAFQGSGLGLTIAKAYAEMLEGEISVVSEESKGSKFTFTIPYTKKQ